MGFFRRAVYTIKQLATLQRLSAAGKKPCYSVSICNSNAFINGVFPMREGYIFLVFVAMRDLHLYLTTNSENLIARLSGLCVQQQQAIC